VRHIRLVLAMATTMVMMIATAAPAMAQDDDCWWIWSIWSGWWLVC
jgi:hypothetical protein